jgi:hypothetical protein
MDMAKSVTATFTLAMFTLTITKAGNGAGTVTGTGINCGADCSQMIDYGTMVTLSAAASTGSSFTGWSGACTGTSTCTVTMTQARSVTATFTLDTFLLSVSTAGTGAGRVTAPGITCGAGATDCTETLDYGSMVTLMASASTGSSFAGWSGACTGTAACTVTMTQARSVAATFTINNYTLTVMPAGNGAGTVAGTGINCGSDCDESFVYNTSVTLTATASASSNFSGWSAPCTGTGTCTVTMDQARTVTATFTLKTFTLRVTKSGTGDGTLTGGEINCGTTCTATVNYGSTVTLAAAASTADATASKFDDWTGAGCTGQGGCTIANITANVTVDAGFTLLPNIMFVTSTLQDGNLGGLTGADAICRARAGAAGLSGTYVAYLSSTVGGVQILAPSRVGGATGWIRVDGLPVMNTITQMTAGTLVNPPVLTESGANAASFPEVWTGTRFDGSLGPTCGTNWTINITGEAASGNCTTTSSKVVQDGTRGCSTVAQRLYCLGIDRKATAP